MRESFGTPSIYWNASISIAYRTLPPFRRERSVFNKVLSLELVLFLFPEFLIFFRVILLPFFELFVLKQVLLSGSLGGGVGGATGIGIQLNGGRRAPGLLIAAEGLIE